MKFLVRLMVGLFSLEQRCPGLGLESRFLGLQTCGLGLGLGFDTSGLELDFQGIFTF